MCNDAGAAVVTVPYEQRVFERRLKELRYETGDQSDRLSMLHEIGRDMGRILESVPGFTGAVSTEGASGTLVHLRLTLSAAELALLPFELAEVPVGSTSSAVSIQTRPPVSVTRHIRTVSSEGLGWPDRPRILFVSSDPQEVPFDEHRAALVDAIKPFQYPKKDDPVLSTDGRREQFGRFLTILKMPTLLELQSECASERYTHIHVLTHGELDLLAGESYGIVLRDEDGNPDVVSGERFVSAVTRIGHRPAVVTIASCDSGNVGSLVIPGASFAHAVHQAGVPFVVGSQFPLSKQGSVPLTARLYQGLLWGDHPLRVLQQARAELHARFNTNWHDWASVVAYEALPAALDEYLDALRYAQAKCAVDAALECIDLAVASPAVVSQETLDGLQRAVDKAIERLPLDGQFRVECVGLRAGSRKRIAQATFDRASAPQAGARHLLKNQYDLLDHARLGYADAVRGMLVNDSRAVQRKATLHWVLVQKVSIGTVLEVPPDRGEWEAACLAATHYLKHPDAEQRAWAHASLAELWLLRLAGDDLTEAQQSEYAREALRHANDLNDYYLGVDEFPIKSSRRQFERYVTWWGTPAFTEALDAHGFKRRASWGGPSGLVAVAAQLVRAPRPPGSSTPVRRRPDAAGRAGCHGASAAAGAWKRRDRRAGRPDANGANDANGQTAAGHRQLPRRSAARRPRRLPVDRIRRRRGAAPHPDRLRHAGVVAGALETHRGAARRRALLRAVRALAHRLGPHRRRAAAVQGGEERPAVRRRLVQRLAAHLRPARRPAGRDVLQRDSRFRAAVERVSGWRDDSRRRRRPAGAHAPGRHAAHGALADERTAQEAAADLDPRAQALWPRAGRARGLQPLPQGHAVHRGRRQRAVRYRRARRHGVQGRQRRAQRHQHRAAGGVRGRQRPACRRRARASARGLDQGAAEEAESGDARSSICSRCRTTAARTT